MADENATTPEETTTPVETPTPIQSNITLTQSVGGQVFELNPKSVAEQIQFADGTNLAVRMATVERAASGAAVVRFADDIAGRDALTGVNAGDICIVADATADETVEKGGARYVKQGDGS